MTKWLNPTLLTCDHIGICFNEGDFHRELRRMKVPPSQWSSWLTEGALATTHHLTSEKGSRASIVCIPIRTDMDGVNIAGILMHEAMHVLQDYLEYIGEQAVGRETQAYAVQAISVRLMEAYRDELYRKFDKAVKKDEKEWTTSTISKPTPTALPSAPSTLTETTVLYSNVPLEKTTSVLSLNGWTTGAVAKTGLSVSTTKTLTIQ